MKEGHVYPLSIFLFCSRIIHIWVLPLYKLPCSPHITCASATTLFISRSSWHETFSQQPTIYCWLWLYSSHTVHSSSFVLQYLSVSFSDDATHVPPHFYAQVTGMQYGTVSVIYWIITKYVSRLPSGLTSFYHLMTPIVNLDIWHPIVIHLIACKWTAASIRENIKPSLKSAPGSMHELAPQKKEGKSRQRH